MTALASPDWGIGSSQLDWPAMLPANARFDVANMANPVMGEIVSGIQAAIRSDDFRFDASDAMPAEVWTAFNAGMVRLFREGSLENLDELSVRDRGRTSRPPGPRSEHRPADRERPSPAPRSAPEPTRSRRAFRACSLGPLELIGSRCCELRQRC